MVRLLGLIVLLLSFSCKQPVETFMISEFNCKSGETIPAIYKPNVRKLISKLTKLKTLYKDKMIITSGWRSEKYNAKIGGAPNSAHLRGWATDIQITNAYKRHRLLKSAFYTNFPRIGVYPTFIHLDIDPDLPQEILWLSINKDM